MTRDVINMPWTSDIRKLNPAVTPTINTSCELNIKQLRWSSDIERPSRAVDSGLILSRVKPMTLKLVFTASLLVAHHLRDSVENKLTSSAVGKNT